MSENRKKAVMYGGGNIGRGFIGMLFSGSGYDVTFIDVAEPVIEGLNAEGRYPVRIVSGEGFEDVWVERVRAVNGNAPEAAKAIAEADIMATAVGVNVLKFIVPNLVRGIRERIRNGKGKLNIIICENLIDADKILEGFLKAELSEEEGRWFEENIGLIEASIGRMVPVQTEKMKDGNPLRVCVERYGYLPVNKAAFKGEIPRIRHMVPAEPFDFYIKRKLYVHNMGHAVCAYLGMYRGLTYIYESVAEADTESVVQNAMLESALALSKTYGGDMEPLMKHVQDLLHRFTNKALEDTCARVGNDPVRKLSPSDRLIGAARMCLEAGVTPAFISVGAAGAVYSYLKELGKEQTKEQAEEILEQIGGLACGDPLWKYILPLYERFAEGGSVKEIRRLAENLRAAELADVI